MSPQPERPFTISDAMILVAAAAVGLILVRSYLPGFVRHISTLGRQIADPWGLWVAYGWLQGPVACFVIPFMAGLVAMRLLPPRPPRRRLLSQPGFVACVAALASLMPGLRWYGINRHDPGFQREVPIEVTWYLVTCLAPHVVVGA